MPPHLACLPANGVARTARISPSRQHATRMVYGDGADPAGFPGPIRPRHDFVALTGQCIAHLLGQTLLDAQLIRLVRVRLKRAWIAVCGKARGFNGRLWQHTEHGNIQEDLQHRLALHITTGRAKRHKGFTVLKDQRWTRCQTWALPRGHGTGMPLNTPELRTTR